MNYRSIVGMLMYLVGNTRPDCTFVLLGFHMKWPSSESVDIYWVLEMVGSFSDQVLQSSWIDMSMQILPEFGGMKTQMTSQV